MAIKKPIPITFNLDSHNSVQSVCAVIHIDDKNTETLDLSLMQGGEHIKTPSNSTVTARFVRVKDKILISDNVPCAVQEKGNIYIPIDNAAAHMLVGEIKIEVNIVDENDVLTMQFPLVIKVNNTILADAEISPESEGTIPELLEEAREAAESATQAAEAATEAISTKQDKLTAGQNITITEENVISASSGSNDYTELENKPSINNVTLSGNKSSGDLNLQDKLTAGQNITIEGNVISAEGGGVTSYDDLTDKPQFQTRWESSLFDLSGVNVFNDFGSYKELDGKRIWSIMVDELIPRIPNFSIAFNQLIDVNGIFRTEPPYQGILNPDEIIDLNDGMPNKAIPFLHIYPNLGINNKGYGLLINLVDPNIYAQLFVWLDYQDIPHIGYRTKTTYTNWSDLIELGSGGVTSYNELENKPKIHGIPIEGNQGHAAYNLFGLSTPLSWMLNFGDLVNMSEKNGILNATINQVGSLPEFMNPKDKHFIIFDYQAESQGIWDIAVWIDAATNEPKMAFRAGTNNIYSVSDWVELTGGGSQIVSGVVNANGTITFTDSEGNTFTTSGESVIGADGFSPSATVQQTASGATITVTDKNGTTTANISNGAPGQDYVLTDTDKQDIADIVLSELPTTEGVLYGNQSN